MRRPRQVISNEFIILRDKGDEGHTGLARRLADTDHLIPVNQPRKPIYGILPRNVQQTMAFDLLMDDEIRLLSLLGSAGTGKTLLAVAAGMAKVFNEERYEKLLVARPVHKRVAAGGGAVTLHFLPGAVRGLLRQGHGRVKLTLVLAYGASAVKNQSC